MSRRVCVVRVRLERPADASDGRRFYEMEGWATVVDARTPFGVVFTGRTGIVGGDASALSEKSYDRMLEAEPWFEANLKQLISSGYQRVFTEGTLWRPMDEVQRLIAEEDAAEYASRRSVFSRAQRVMSA